MNKAATKTAIILGSGGGIGKALKNELVSIPSKGNLVLVKAMIYYWILLVLMKLKKLLKN